MAGRHILFLVHGMGVYGKMKDGKYQADTKGWFDDIKATLKSVYDEFIKGTVAGGADFDTLYDFEEIEFDSRFEPYRDAWEKQAAKWSVFNFDGGVLGKLNAIFKGNSDHAFLWTHVADVLLYTQAVVKDGVQPYVAQQVFQKLKARQAKADLAGWSVIAHSLGTAVINDTLPKIHAQIEADPVLAAAMLRPRVICMLANVSRALSGQEAYLPELAPHSACEDNYISCDHALDPFTIPFPFRPPTPVWTKSAGYAGLYDLKGYYLAKEFFDWAIKPGDFKTFAGIVPHDASNYLRQPEVAVELWSRLAGYEAEDLPGVAAKVERANKKLVKDQLTEEATAKAKEWLEQQAKAKAADLEDYLKKIIAGLKQVEEGAQ